MKRYILILTVSLPLFLAATNNPQHKGNNHSTQTSEEKNIDEHSNPPTLWQSIVQAFIKHF